MILVDTSIWIDHLHASEPGLVEFLGDDEVGCHPAVIEELALGSTVHGCGRATSDCSQLVGTMTSPMLKSRKSLADVRPLGQELTRQSVADAGKPLLGVPSTDFPGDRPPACLQPSTAPSSDRVTGCGLLIVQGNVMSAQTTITATSSASRYNGHGPNRSSADAVGGLRFR